MGAAFGMMISAGIAATATVLLTSALSWDLRHVPWWAYPSAWIISFAVYAALFLTLLRGAF